MTETTSSSRTKIVLSLDVGTTTVKAILISKDGVILGRSHEKVKCKMLCEIFTEKKTGLHFPFATLLQ